MSPQVDPPPSSHYQPSPQPLPKISSPSANPGSAAQRRTTLRLATIPLDQAPPPERGIRMMALVVVVILLSVIIWTVTHQQAPHHEPLEWAHIAPPETTSMHPWKYVVIHHSASRGGNAQIIDHEHVTNRGWDGIGYHFVIGNGSDMPLGRIEATFRWRLQQHGAHAGAQVAQKIYNTDGIGICLIGNYEQQKIDPYVEQRLVELCAQLIDRTPTLSVSRIIGHRDVPGKKTACPGQAVDLERIRFLVRQELQQRGLTVR
jgi:N-acetylmuramoyl-L-alanine amidase